MRHVTRILFLALLAAIAIAPGALAQTDVLITEYIEGSSNNKAIELFNTTATDIDLGAGQYKLLLYFNGATTSTSIALTGVLASGARFVVAHSSAGAAILAVANLTTGSLQFNGNDAVVLAKGATDVVVDAIGQVGFDPGTQWGTGLVSTQDNTIRRKSLVCDGDTNTGDAFDPSIEWDGFATDTFDGLGAHTIGCGPTPVDAPTWGAIKTLYR
jgi:predicted extracellular nuclease